jgi:hypothetical protein
MIIGPGMRQIYRQGPISARFADDVAIALQREPDDDKKDENGYPGKQEGA